VDLTGNDTAKRKDRQLRWPTADKLLGKMKT
jgi:hypothetical protein